MDVERVSVDFCLAENRVPHSDLMSASVFVFLRMRLPVFFLIFISFAHAQSLVVTNGMHHLRNAADREWSSFPAQAESKLSIVFEAQDAKWKTLRLRQRDVK